MQDNKVAEIYLTKDYKKFKNFESNRLLDKTNYAKLYQSIKRKALLIPIVVSSDFYVIDGQHRLKIYEELDIPIPYYIANGYGEEEMIEANLIAKQWTTEDFLRKHFKNGLEPYVFFEEVKQQYRIHTNDLLKIISRILNEPVTQTKTIFNQGRLTLSEEQREKVVEFFECLNDFSTFKEYRTTRFVSAFLELYTCGYYDHKTMLTKLEQRNMVLQKQPTKEDYLELLLSRIYSFGAKQSKLLYDRSKKKVYKVD